MSLQMAAARLFVQNKGPYFTSMIYSLIPRPLPGLGTLGTSNKLIMSYDPEWFESLSVEQAAACLVHEAMHVFRDHYGRGEDFPDRAKFNKAADLAINPDLRDMGWELPDSHAIYPEQFGFEPYLTAEQYYYLLEQQEKEQSNNGNENQPGQAGSQPPPGQQPPGNSPSTYKGCCGSVAGNPGAHEQEEEDKLQQEEPGAVRTEAEVKEIVQQTAREMKDYVQQGRGKLPQSLVEVANNALLPPKVKWRQVLPRLIRKATGRMEAGGQDFSRRRPSKRSFVRGTLIPGMISNEPEIVMIRDTSGSMGKEQLMDAQNEAVGAMKALGIDEVWFMDADAAAGKPKRVRIRDIPKLPITGRGGTDFGPAIEEAQKLNPRPDVILYFTDGDGDAPDAPPRGMEVVWVIVKSYWNKKPCDWGHCVFVDD